MYSVILIDSQGVYEYVEQFEPGSCLCSTVGNLQGACEMSFDLACECVKEMFSPGFHVEASIIDLDDWKLYKSQEVAKCTRSN